MRDLNLSAHIGELLDAGVTSFKIEGRLKDVGYIKNVVGLLPPRGRRGAGREAASAAGFSRGEHPGFHARYGQELHARRVGIFLRGQAAGRGVVDTPKAVGEYVGRVVRVEKNRFRLDRGGLLAAGDGICFLTDRGFAGTNVNAADGDCVTPNRMEGIVPGTEVYRNYDHRFNQLLARSRTRRRDPRLGAGRSDGRGCQVQLYRL